MSGCPVRAFRRRSGSPDIERITTVPLLIALKRRRDARKALRFAQVLVALDQVDGAPRRLRTRTRATLGRV